METNVNYTIVGAFVIILIAATVLAIVWLSSGFSFEQFNTYAIYMNESVSGLNVDASVEYNGVEVGSVKSIDIDPRNPEVVEILISVKNTTPITQGTTAMLGSKGITGIAYVALKDKGTNLNPLTPPPGQPYPVIKTIPSFFVRIDTTLSMLSKNFSKLSDSIQSLLNPENQEAIKQTLANLKEITGTLAENSKKLDGILENTSKATQQLTPLMQSGTGAFRIFETQTLPEMYRLMYNLNNMSRSITEMTIEIKQNPSILIRGSTPQPLGPGERR